MLFEWLPVFANQPDRRILRLKTIDFVTLSYVSIYHDFVRLRVLPGGVPLFFDLTRSPTRPAVLISVLFTGESVEKLWALFRLDTFLQLIHRCTKTPLGLLVPKPYGDQLKLCPIEILFSLTKYGT